MATIVTDIYNANTAINSTARAGDTVLIRGCNYISSNGFNPVLSIYKSGSPGNPITIKNYPGETVNIGQDRVNNDPDTYTGCIDITSSYIVLDGINVVESNGPAIRAYSTNYKTSGDYPELWIRDIVIQNCILQNGNHSCFHLLNINGLKILNVTARRFLCQSDRVWSKYGDHAAGGSFNKIAHLEIGHSSFGDIYGEGLCIEGYRSGGYSSFDIDIHDSIFYNGHPDDMTVYFQCVSDYGYNTSFRNNIVMSTTRPAWLPGEWVQEITPMTRWRAPGLWILTSETFNGQPDVAFENWRFHDNLFINCSEALIFEQSGSQPVRNNWFYNNTFINNDVAFTGPMWGIELAPGSVGNIFKNNLIYCQSGQTWYSSSRPSNIDSAFDFSNNLTYGGSNTRPSFAIGSGDVLANPQLINPNAQIPYLEDVNPENYKPSPTSPAVNAGITTPYTTDFFGSSRTGGWEIGFSEYTYVTPPTEHNLYSRSIRSQSKTGRPTLWSPSYENDLVALGLKSSSELERPGVATTHHLNGDDIRSEPRLEKPTAFSPIVDNNLTAISLKTVPKLETPTVTWNDLFGELIQYKSGIVPYTATQTYITLTFDTPPTPGSLLIAGHYSGNGIVTAPTGWNVAFWLSQPIDDDEGGLFYKIAGPNEPSSVTVYCASANEHVMTIAEFGGPYSQNVLDKEVHTPYTVTDQPLTVNSGTISQSHNLVVVLGAGRDYGPEPLASGVGFTSGYTVVDIHESTYKWIDLEFKRITLKEPQAATWDAVGYYNAGHHIGLAIFKQLVIHSLTTTGIESNGKLGRPQIGQKHNLISTEITNPSEVSIPDFSQIHALIPISIKVINRLPKPKARYPSSEEALSVGSLSWVTKPDISQTHILTGDSINNTDRLNRPQIGQTHALSADGITNNSVLETPEITHVHALRSNSVEVPTVLDNPTLSLVPKDRIVVVWEVYFLGSDIEVLSAHSSITD